MSAHVPHAGHDASLVLGDHAVVPGLAAAVLVRAIGDWRRAVPPGMGSQEVQCVERAVAALRASAALFLADAQAQRLPTAGSAEGQGKCGEADSGAWISTRDAAGLLGISTRRVRQLACERTLDSEMVGGRMYFHRGQVCSLAARRET